MNHVKPAAHSLHKVTWPSFRDTVKLLARDMSETSEIRMRVRSFIPIIRGGMIPAMLLSELFNYDIPDVLHISPNGCSKLTYSDAELRTFVFVDDILDTGNTILQILKSYPSARFVTPYGKPLGLSKIPPSALVVKPRLMVPDNVWVEFPWDQATLYRSELARPSARLF